MKIENIQVYGFEPAIRGMRNPMDSWGKSDSNIMPLTIYTKDNKNYNVENFVLGEADKILSQNLTKSGTEHCKHLRMIQVWFDLTLPRYVWTEFDTYRHVEKISCSTMHKLTSYTLDDSFFEYPVGEAELLKLNFLIRKYKNSKDIHDFYKLKNELLEGFLQKRTINTSYMTLLSMRQQRKNHKLEQWHNIIDMIENLPYFTELTGIYENTERE